MVETRTIVSDRYQEGVNLSNRGEAEQATSALLDCLLSDPGNPIFVDGFLTHVFLCPRSVELETLEPPPLLTLALNRRNFSTVLRDGPSYLASNARNVATLRGLAEACSHFGDFEAELRYVQAALDVEPDNQDLFRTECEVLERLRRFDDTLQGWRTIEAETPEDSQTASRVARLTIAAGRQRHCLLDDGDRQDAVDFVRLSRRLVVDRLRPGVGFISHQACPSALDAPVPPTGSVRLTPMQQLQALIREFPSNADLHLQLALLYLEKGRDYDAEQVLVKARTETDDDRRVAELWEDVTMLRLAKKIQLARDRVAAEDKEEVRKELAELVERRDRFELQVFQQRSQREPHDMLLRYQLGCRWKQHGKRREAYQCFEEILADPVQRPAAALEMAECLVDSQDFVRAFRYYRLAAESAIFPEQLTSKIKALYRAALLSLRFKLESTARRYLARVLRIDPSHVEARALLERVTGNESADLAR